MKLVIEFKLTEYGHGEKSGNPEWQPTDEQASRLCKAVESRLLDEAPRLVSLYNKAQPGKTENWVRVTIDRIAVENDSPVVAGILDNSQWRQ